jgi:hypothetical protein
MARTLSAVLAVLLATSPLQAQELRRAISREAAAIASAAQAASTETRYPRPFLWTGIGLLGGGGLYLGIAGLADELCDDIRSSRVSCESNSGMIRGFGFGLMAAGGVILAIGASKRKPASPQIVTTAGGGIAIRHSVSF